VLLFGKKIFSRNGGLAIKTTPNVKRRMTKTLVKDKEFQKVVNLGIFTSGHYYIIFFASAKLIIKDH